MPFPRPPHPDLRQWDNYACNSAIVAQILYMGGRLRYPFDTARFDQQVRRQPGRPAPNMEGVRLIAYKLPVTLFSVAPSPSEDRADPVKVGKELKNLGHPDDQITAYLKGPLFRVNQQIVEDDLRLQRELGDRYRRTIRPDSSRYARGFLDRGAVLAAALNVSASASHAVLLIPCGQEGGVLIYDPAHGLERGHLEILIKMGLLQLDESGFMAYLMS